MMESVTGRDEATIKVLLCDDSALTRAGVRMLLEMQQDFEVVAEAEDGLQAVALTRETRPDVVLMDLKMPKLDGVEATSRIKEELPETQVVILTTYETDADIHRAMTKGAKGYLLKEAPIQEIYAAVRSAAGGLSSLSPSVQTRLVDRMRADPDEELSPREIEILELMSRGKTNKEISNILSYSEETIKKAAPVIYAKLGTTDRTHACTIAVARGLIRRPDV